MAEDINRELLDLLARIADLAWSPHDSNKPYDPRLCMTLGQISGICDKAIEDYRRRTAR